MTETDTAAPRGRRPRGPLKKKNLENAALYHLQRFAASAEGLRRVLARRVEKAAREDRCDRAEASAWIDDIVGRFVRSGLVDDRAFAEGRTASLRRRGESARRIALTLREKGVDPELAAEALAAEDGEDSDAEFRAACRLVRRRRLGAMRPAAERVERRDRDLAALARAGFRLDVARRALALEDAQALEAAIAGEQTD